MEASALFQLGFVRVGVAPTGPGLPLALSWCFFLTLSDPKMRQRPRSQISIGETSGLA
jgi:hypothetical protein